MAASTARSALIRKTFVMRMKPGQEAAYKALHDELWPDMRAALLRGGVKTYTISLLPDTNQLFGYVEIDSESAWAAVADTEVCRRWWKACAPLMEFDGDRPASIELKEMFHMEGASGSE